MVRLLKQADALGGGPACENGAITAARPSRKDDFAYIEIGLKSDEILFSKLRNLWKPPVGKESSRLLRTGRSPKLAIKEETQWQKWEADPGAQAIHEWELIGRASQRLRCRSCGGEAKSRHLQTSLCSSSGWHYLPQEKGSNRAAWTDNESQSQKQGN